MSMRKSCRDINWKISLVEFCLITYRGLVF